LDASTMATFVPLWTSSTTTSVTLSTLTVGGVTPLTPSTTYYLRVGALNSNNVPNFGTTQSTQTTAGGAVASSTITAVFVSSLTVVWTEIGRASCRERVEVSAGAWPNRINGNVSSITTNTSDTTLTYNLGALIADST